MNREDITEETQEIIESISDGSLAKKMQMKMNYITKGAGLGAIIGIGIASIFGGSRVMYGIAGLAVGAGLGRISVPSKKKDND